MNMMIFVLYAAFTGICSVVIFAAERSILIVFILPYEKYRKVIGPVRSVLVLIQTFQRPGEWQLLSVKEVPLIYVS